MDSKRSIFIRPHWSLRSSFLTALCLLAIVTTVILVTVKKSLWLDLEIVTTVLAPIMFVYMTVVLYLGVKFEKEKGFSVNLNWREIINVADLLNVTTVFDIGFPFSMLFSEAGRLGLVLGIILDLIVSVLLIVFICAVLWFGINALPETIVIIFFPLFYFYRRSLRYLVVRGRAYRGNLGKAMIHAFFASIIYSAWFYTIILVSHYVFHRIRGK